MNILTIKDDEDEDEEDGAYLYEKYPKAFIKGNRNKPLPLIMCNLSKTS